MVNRGKGKGKLFVALFPLHLISTTIFACQLDLQEQPIMGGSLRTAPEVQGTSQRLRLRNRVQLQRQQFKLLQ